MSNPIVTVITPTTGKDSLFKLIDSLHAQEDVSYRHILLWDEKREDKFLYPDVNLRIIQPKDLENNPEINSIVVRGALVQGEAYGSALRAVGLMAANTPYVTFADDDVWYEPHHLKTMIEFLIKSKSNWGYCLRRIWNSSGECLGVDQFESVGDSPNKKVPYEMVDNNCMIFNRRFGTSAAVLYRETTGYNDDRLMYEFLKKHAGLPLVNVCRPSVNQVCPQKLEQFFRENCT